MGVLTRKSSPCTGYSGCAGKAKVWHKNHIGTLWGHLQVQLAWNLADFTDQDLHQETEMNSKLCFATIMLLACSVVAQGAATPGSWDSYTATTATGSVGDVTVNAVSSATAPIVGLSPNHFGVHWDAASALGDPVLGLTVSEVNAGDEIDFSFSSPLTNGTVLYIENFDSNSAATITAAGATSISVLTNSMVSYSASGSSTGVLSSMNAGYDGNGDIALVLEGAVTSVSLDYTGGDGANGVFYAFAEPMAQAVPEPTSVLVMASLCGLGGVAYYFRRRR